MASSSATPTELIERFPALTADERAAVLAWVRQTPLVYGRWKWFKALYKKAEAPALQADGEPDIELLGALLGRLDAAAITRESPHLKSVTASIATDGRNQPQSVTSGNMTYTVGGRRQWDGSGWRLTISVAGEGAEVSGIRQGFAALGRALGLSSNTPSTARSATWDFDGREYFGQVNKVRLEGTTLHIKGRSGPEFVVDVSDPAFPHFVSEAPRPATWQYMKRRARRLLREMRKKRPALYWPLAVQMLRESGGGALDFKSQWAAIDVLYRNTERWEQKRPGRGPYLRTAQPAYNRLRREEAAPDIWDAHLSEMPALYLDERVPVQANATALKVLRAHGQEAPPLAAAQMARFLDGPVPILKSIATRAFVDLWERGEAVPGAVAAHAFLMSGARVRRRLRDLIERQLSGNSAQWRQNFAKQLTKVLQESPGSRRGRTAALFLAERFPDLISNDAFWRHLSLWLSLNRDDVNAWVIARVRESGTQGDMTRLANIAALPEAQRDLIFQAFVATAAQRQPAMNEAYQLVKTNDLATNELGWRYLEASGIKPGTVREIWQRLLLNHGYDETILRAACCDASAKLFARAEWPNSDIARWSQGYYSPWDNVCRFAGPNFFDAVLGFLPDNDKPNRIFRALSRLPAETAREVLSRHRAAARGFRPTAEQIRAALTWQQAWRAVDATTASAWQFLAESDVEPATLREVWRELFSGASPAGAIPVEAIPAAVRIFQRAEIPADEIEAWLTENAELAASWAPEFFNAILTAAPGATKVSLVLRAQPEQWREARPALLRLLHDRALRAAFWHGVFERLRDDTRSEAESSELSERVLNDTELCATFELLSKEEIETFFATTEAAHEPLLLRWLAAHLRELTRDDPTLIAAATCPLPGVHERALSYIKWLELDLPLALRLMESNLPPAFEAGRRFFEAAKPDSDEETTHALALCDSPNTNVQAFGRAYIEARRDSLLRGDLLQMLTENPDPKMQAWLGEQLLQLNGGSSSGVQTRDFDAAVLRTRGRSRRAKEAVKQRLSQSRTIAAQEQNIDIAALLETARSTTPRDREWALQQLAALTLAGHKIEGVEVQKPE